MTLALALALGACFRDTTVDTHRVVKVGSGRGKVGDCAAIDGFGGGLVDG
jgi:hypothetical protein